MDQMSLLAFHLPASLLLGGMAGFAYVIGYVRHRGLHFTLLDAVLVVAIMATGTAVAMPLVSGNQDRANADALRENLRTLREQIAQYKVDHGEQPPLLFEGGFPQLTHATNAEGTPGPAGDAHPCGPYLPGAVPMNPYTGVSVVTPTETFPPTAPSGVGGWLYHQETGGIAADVEGHLRE